jgi:hypothetical protein
VDLADRRRPRSRQVTSCAVTRKYLFC